MIDGGRYVDGRIAKDWYFFLSLIYCTVYSILYSVQYTVYCMQTKFLASRVRDDIFLLHYSIYIVQAGLGTAIFSVLTALFFCVL